MPNRVPALTIDRPEVLDASMQRRERVEQFREKDRQSRPWIYATTSSAPEWRYGEPWRAAGPPSVCATT